MKAYGGRGIAPRILNVGFGRGVVSGRRMLRKCFWGSVRKVELLKKENSSFNNFDEL
jgi:hypothetical protein